MIQKQAVIADCFLLHKWIRLTEGKRVTDYDASLRKPAKYYRFGDHLDDAVSGKFVSDLQQDTIQQFLLLEVDLTYSRAIGIARTMIIDVSTKLK